MSVQCHRCGKGIITIHERGCDKMQFLKCGFCGHEESECEACNE